MNVSNLNQLVRTFCLLVLVLPCLGKTDSIEHLPFGRLRCHTQRRRLDAMEKLYHTITGEKRDLTPSEFELQPLLKETADSQEAEEVVLPMTDSEEDPKKDCFKFGAESYWTGKYWAGIMTLAGLIGTVATHAPENGYNFQHSFLIVFMFFLPIYLAGLLYTNNKMMDGYHHAIPIVTLVAGMGLFSWVCLMPGATSAAALTSCNTALVVGFCTGLPILIWVLMFMCLGKHRQKDSLMGNLLKKKFYTITILAAALPTMLIGGSLYGALLHNWSLFGLFWAFSAALAVFGYFGTRDVGHSLFSKTEGARRWMTHCLAASTLAVGISISFENWQFFGWAAGFTIFSLPLFYAIFAWKEGPKTGTFGDVANRISLSLLGLGMAGIAVCIGESGSPAVYLGFGAVALCGGLFAFEAKGMRSLLTIAFTLTYGPFALLAKCCDKKIGFQTGLDKIWPE